MLYLVELVHGLLVLLRVASPLPRQVDINLGSDEGEAVGDEAEVGEAVLHHHGREVGALRRVRRHLDPFQGHRVPLPLHQGELSVGLLKFNFNQGHG